MKKIYCLLLLPVCLVLTAYSCGQNGPTIPSATLSWTQSTTPGVTANCVYRGTTAGTYQKPALFCSTAPITTYTDLTVQRSTTYHYAVTAQIGLVEGPYSNDAVAAIPAAPAAPTVNPPQVTKLEPGPAPKLTVSVGWRQMQ